MVAVAVPRLDEERQFAADDFGFRLRCGSAGHPGPGKAVMSAPFKRLRLKIKLVPGWVVEVNGRFAVFGLESYSVAITRPGAIERSGISPAGNEQEHDQERNGSFHADKLWLRGTLGNTGCRKNATGRGYFRNVRTMASSQVGCIMRTQPNEGLLFCLPGMP